MYLRESTEKEKRFREKLELKDKLYKKKRPEMRIELVNGKIEYEIVSANRLYPKDIVITSNMIDDLLEERLKYQEEFSKWWQELLMEERQNQLESVR